MNIKRYVTQAGLACALLLTACGGGGDDTSANPPPPPPPPVADTTPDAFSFAAVGNLFTGTPATSLPATITGIDAAAAVAVSGGEYAINDGPFTAAAGTVDANDTVRVRATASAEPDTAATATLTVGGVQAGFTVTTGPAVNLADVDPEPFVFTPPAEVAPGQIYISEPITVEGINATAPVSISGGTYRIDGGEFTNQAGVVSPGQQVQVRLTAPVGAEVSIASATSHVRVATLSIGGFSQTFVLTIPPAEGEPDTVPDLFTFASPDNALNAEPDSDVTFGPAGIAGLTAAAVISVMDAEYSLDGGATFTAAPGEVTNGSSVLVRVRASRVAGGIRTARITIGDVPAILVVTTRTTNFGSDTEPSAFAFTDAFVQEPGMQVGSETIVLEGFDAPTRVSVTSGEFQLDGRGYTAREQLMLPGQSVQLRGESPAHGGEQSISFTAGGVSATFTIRTEVAEPGNFAPVANAGPDRDVSVIDGVVLDGSDSSDPNNGDVLTYQWEQVSGPAAATLATPDATQTAVTFTTAGDYTFELTVSDTDLSNADLVTIRVFEPVEVNVELGDAQTVSILDGADLSVVAEGFQGQTLTYAWSAKEMPALGGATFEPDNGPEPHVTFLAAGEYIIEVTVSDGVQSETDQVSILVESNAANAPPVPVIAGIGEIHVGDAIYLDGSGSHDADGRVMAFHWELTSLPDRGFPGDLAQRPEEPAEALFYPADDGRYVARLTVRDDAGSTAFEELVINVQPKPPNRPPVAHIAAPATAAIGTEVLLDGSQTSDPDGNYLIHRWDFESTPAGSNALIQPNGLNPAVASFVPDVTGTYEVRLTVTDDPDGDLEEPLSHSVTAIIEVSEGDGGGGDVQAPVVDLQITPEAPVAGETVTIDGSNSTDNEAVVMWTFLVFDPSSNPVEPQFEPGVRSMATFTPEVEGEYLVYLAVQDAAGNESFVEMHINVAAPGPVNTPPVANAGSDQTVPLSVGADLDAGGSSDGDGDTLRFQWSVAEAPEGATATFSHPRVVNPHVDFTMPGIYALRVTVTDLVDVVTDDVIVTVTDDSESTAPTAVLSVTPEAPVAGQEVLLDGSGSSGELTLIGWDFFITDPLGSLVEPSFPGFPDDLSRAAFTPAMPGDYDITLVVVDEEFQENSTSTTITVAPAP